jgi:hypothetical protein
MVVEVEARREPASGVIGGVEVGIGSGDLDLDAAVEEALGLERYADGVTADELAEETGATSLEALAAFTRVVQRAAA